MGEFSQDLREWDELRDQRISVGKDLAYETGTEHVNVLIGKDKAQADFRVSNNDSTSRGLRHTRSGPFSGESLPYLTITLEPPSSPL
jgi:hypothetical protein